MKLDHRTQIAVIISAGFLARQFNAIRIPISFFIDNVDEYFKPILEDKSINSPTNVDIHYRNKSNEIWTLAQISLAEAAYEFHKTNSHIKVYCTVRREVFLRFDEFEDQFQQILGSTIEIEYSKEDFLEIFKKNIKLMNKEDLCHQDQKDPISQFFGRENARITHRFVDKDEDAFDYVLRHTFYRPRDLMIMGLGIADIPAKKRSREAIKEAVDRSTD